MKIVGLIVEYNPLHTGHMYHFNEVKKQSNADLIITIISGSIAMRGEISVFDKFVKAKQALDIGADIVIELPALLSLNTADLFAKYAIMFLNNLKVDEIWIGSESNKETIYEAYYNAMNSKEYNEFINNYLKEGNSYKTSSILAFESLNLTELKSNDVLGLAYYKSIKDLNYNISLKTIKRLGADDNDNELSKIFSSAKSIRNQKENFLDFLPTNVIDDYNKYGFTNNNNDLLFKCLTLIILRTKVNDFKKYEFVTSGIENRFKEITNFTDLNSFVNHLSNKRFTSSKIRRMLLSILFENHAILKDNLNLDFVRVLGFNTVGQKYLNTIKKDLTIYTSIKEGLNDILDFELNVSRIIDSIYSQSISKKELLPPIIKKFDKSL